MTYKITFKKSEFIKLIFIVGFSSYLSSKIIHSLDYKILSHGNF
jgi:hypothetical protein